MKVFIVLASLLAASYASYGHYPINIPVIGKTGVPLESAEIVHARLAHLSQVAAVKSQQGAYHDGVGYGTAAGLGYAGAGLGYAGAGLGYARASLGYHGGYALPIIGHNGVPIDTPEVQHARAEHFAAYAKAAAAAALSGPGEHYRKKRSLYAYPVIGHNGVPLDTPEVQHAKAEHFAAHAKAGGLLGGYGAGLSYGAGLGYAGYGYHGHAQIGHDGQPIETPEVQLLKAKHFQAHAEAKSRIGYGGYAGGYDGGYNGGAYGGAYAGHYGVHIPVIGHGGVPIDTPEVQAARAHHFAALAEAGAKAGYGNEY